MTNLGGTPEYPQCSKREMKPCETPGCSENCAYAYSCHESRMGRTPAAFWPVVGLGILVAMALIV